MPEPEPDKRRRRLARMWPRPARPTSIEAAPVTDDAPAESGTAGGPETRGAESTAAFTEPRPAAQPADLQHADPAEDEPCAPPQRRLRLPLRLRRPEPPQDPEPTPAIPDPPWSPPPAVAGHGLIKRFGESDSEVVALHGIDVSIEGGTFAAIMGPSGSGKSTLMHILAGLDHPSEGTVEIAGQQLDTLTDRELTLLRRDQVGFVFQSFNLLPVLSVEENLRLPLSIAGLRPEADWIDTLLDAVGLTDRRRHRPGQLSGGQQQRVAIARALVTRPAVVFADEPTGNLDSAAGEQVLDLLRRAVDEFNQTIVMVTHEASAAARADRIIFLADGTVVRNLGAMRTDEILDALKRP